MLRSLFISFLSVFLYATLLWADTPIPDPKLETALRSVYASNSISFKTCLENTQVLIRSAIKRRADLSTTQVVIIYSPGEFLRPQSARWPLVPHYDFHVVLMKDDWIYDFAAGSISDGPEVLRVENYFSLMFPQNNLRSLRFKVIPALELLLPEHRTLRMDDKNTYAYIRKVWEQNGSYYKKIISSSTEVKYNKL